MNDVRLLITGNLFMIINLLCTKIQIDCLHSESRQNPTDVKQKFLHK